MQIQLQFAKMSGAGNDFVVLDNRVEAIGSDKPALARGLCSRHFGVGGDGLLLVEKSSVADFSMRYYNADGSHGGMCGNGGRCISRFAFHRGIAGRVMTFEALDYIYKAEVVDPFVKLQMKSPITLKTRQLALARSGKVSVSFVDTGSPHVVIESKEVDSVDVERIGREIRFLTSDFPEGTNVNFVEFTGERTLKLRTYERGVETETLACGTGAVASAIAGSILRGIQSPVTISVRSGEELRVHFDRESDRFTNLVLEGSAHFIFQGQLLYDTSRNVILDTQHSNTQPAL